MFYIYALKSLNHKYIYVWLTNNLDRRIKQHQEWKGKSTSFYKPFELILSENYQSRVEARIREKQLKSWYWKEYLKKLA